MSTAVPTCTKLFRGERGLRLPATGPLLGGLGRSRPALFTVDGRRIPLSEAVKADLAVSVDYANTVYEGTVADGKVTALAPRLRITEEAVLDHLFASRLLIGRVSGRDSTDSFKSAPRLPVLVELSRRSAHGRLAGVIRNATRAARVGGRCYPALSDAADDPLGSSGFTRKISIKRIPSMHVPFEDELIFAWTRNSSGMGSQYYASVATLFGRDPMGDTWHITQHGNPSSGPRLVVRAADGRVGGC